MPSLVRTQVQLTKEQAHALKTQAHIEERSMADLVRESVDEYLARRSVRDRHELIRRARDLIGRYHSGRQNVAENHDRYLDDAFDT